jgi:hypothetical protein
VVLEPMPRGAAPEHKGEDKRMIKLTSGVGFDENQGTIALGADGDLYLGDDMAIDKRARGDVWRNYVVDVGTDPDSSRSTVQPVTHEDRQELARAMISRWAMWAGLTFECVTRDADRRSGPVLDPAYVARLKAMAAPAERLAAKAAGPSLVDHLEQRIAALQTSVGQMGEAVARVEALAERTMDIVQALSVPRRGRCAECNGSGRTTEKRTGVSMGMGIADAIVDGGPCPTCEGTGRAQ